MLVYVTVGSTGFDALVSAVCSEEFFRTLADRGFHRLIVQYGSSSEAFDLPKTVSGQYGVSVEGFSYTRMPQQYVEQADLIICHAGTGSILEALHAGKPAIVVPNHELMDSHQSEISLELAAAEYLLVSEPDQLARVVDSGKYMELVPYAHADPRPIGEILDEESSRTNRDPEWKKAFVKYMNAELALTNERFPVMGLATVDLEGRPAVRIVSPRGFVGDGFLKVNSSDHGQWSSDVLTFCTHAKSNKVQELVNTNDIQAICWLPNIKVQIRCSGHAHLLFHPDNPNYTTLSLDMRHRVWPRDGTPEEEREAREEQKEIQRFGGSVEPLVNGAVEIDVGYIREQAYLHHSPVLQAWYSWPAPGKIRSADASLYPMEIPKIKDKEESEKYEANARRNYVLIFIDVNQVDIVDLNESTRRIHTRRSDTSWSVANVNP
ncbi:hypothetical protein FB645_004947 [Coemansia sp. IMI 203386]|nr:hypothetical protein FB645_004947 [Coemansia sp. IMI 203386]